MFTALLDRFRRRTFTTQRQCFWCRGVETLSTDSAQLLQEWGDAVIAYHSECLPIGMASHERLTHALRWRYPANEHEMETK